MVEEVDGREIRREDFRTLLIQSNTIKFIYLFIFPTSSLVSSFFERTEEKKRELMKLMDGKEEENSRTLFLQYTQ